jgi:soluble lytic murein transglycosylase
MKSILALIVVVQLLVPMAVAQTSDAALRRAMRLDNDQRDAGGKLPLLQASEHLARAETYMANRLFPQAREHWQKVLDNYPEDPGLPKALFGTARSYMWERQYEKAVFWFEKLNGDTSKDGREGLAFKGASLVRLGKNLEAAKVYEEYVNRFPNGERIESAHLNLIDAYREAGKYDDAEDWVDRTVTRFLGKGAEVNALHAKLRMEIFRENYGEASATASRLLSKNLNLSGSMAKADEVFFLKGFALSKLGRKGEAQTAYAQAARNGSTYYGALAIETAHDGLTGVDLTADSRATSSQYPIVFRSELLAAASKFKVDPRFLLAIMKQESSFRASAKSPAGARGLLQLVYDTAIKYKSKAGYPNLQPDQLYSPSVNISVGAAYIADLKSEFGGLYEAIAASYNGGEDNAARWLSRSKPKEPGIFTSEVGFAETKAYVFKVMNNYRVYRELYDDDLKLR